MGGGVSAAMAIGSGRPPPTALALSAGWLPTRPKAWSRNDVLPIACRKAERSHPCPSDLPTTVHRQDVGSD